MPVNNTVGYPVQFPAGDVTKHAARSVVATDPISLLFAGGFDGGYWPVRPGATLWQDAARTISANIGDPVRVRDSLAGTYGHMKAPSDAARPVAVVEGALNTTLFDGVDDLFEAENDAPNTPNWIFGARVRNNNVVSMYSMLFSIGPVAGGFVGENHTSTNFTTSNQMYLWYHPFTVGLYPLALNDPSLILVIKTGDNWVVRLNGVVVLSNATPSSVDGTLMRRVLGNLHRVPPTSQPWNGSIGSAVQINRSDNFARDIIEANLV